MASKLKVEIESTGADTLIRDMSSAKTSVEKFSDKTDEATKTLGKLEESTKGVSEKVKTYTNAEKRAAVAELQHAKALKEIQKRCGGVSSALGSLCDESGKMVGKFINAQQESKMLERELHNLTATYNSLTEDEKNSQFGQNLSRMLDATKKKAADLKDMIADNREELKHLASDTSLTDSINAYTGLIGNMSSAIVAITGNTDKFQKVIMKLAQIETITKAVQSLTVAFQKQNLVLLKNPYVAVAAAVVALGVAIYELSKKTRKTTEELNKEAIEADKLRRSEERTKRETDALAKSAVQLISKYKILQTQWKNLRTEAEKKKFIKDNETAFRELGKEIRNVNDANNFLINNAPNVIKALQAMAKAEAYKEVYKQAEEENAKWLLRKKTRATGDYYVTAKAGDRSFTATGNQKDLPDDWVKAGVSIGNGASYEWGKGQSGAGNYILDAEGAKKVNAYRNKMALELQKSLSKNITDYVDASKDLWSSAEKEAEEAAKKAGLTTSGYGGDIVHGNGNNNNNNNNNNDTNNNVTEDTRTQYRKLIDAVDEWKKTLENGAFKTAEWDVELKKRMDAANDYAQAHGIEIPFKADTKEQDELTKKIADINNDLSVFEKERSYFISLGLDTEELDIEIAKLNENLKSIGADYDAQAIEKVKNKILFEMRELDDDIDFSGIFDNLGEVTPPVDVLLKLKKNLENKMKEIMSDNKTKFDDKDLNDIIDGYIQKIEDGNQAIENLGNTANSVAGVLGNLFTMDADASAWDWIAEISDGFSQIISQVPSVIAGIQAISAAKVSASALNVAATEAETAATTSETGAEVGKALASATASGAKMPFPANLAAIAAGVAAVMAVVGTIASAVAKAKKHAVGGIVGGTTTVGDNVLARLNKGEMVLNNRQQANLFRMLNHPNTTTNNQVGELSFRIKGADLVGAISNYNKKHNR